jgi:hypothetical protein
MKSIFIVIFFFISFISFSNNLELIHLEKFNSFYNISEQSLDSLLDKINDDDPRIILEREENIYTELFDQFAHTFVSFIILILFYFGVKKKSLALGAISGFIIGLIREVTEEGNLVTFDIVGAVFLDVDAYIDLSFWSLGGLLATLFIKLKKV